MERSRKLAAGQRRRIIELLEVLTDADEKEQCPRCGDYYKQLSSHTPHCDG